MYLNYSELVLASVVALFTAIHFLINYRLKSQILLSDVFIWFAGALFGIGPFVSFLLGYRDFPEFSMPLFSTYFSVILFFIGLILGKFCFKNTLNRHPKMTRGGSRSPVFYFIDHCREIPVSNLILLFVIFAAIKMYNFSIGGGLSGFNSLDVMLSKNYLVVVLEQITEPFVIVLLFCSFYSIVKKNKRAWFITIPILLLLSIDSFLQGRREMVFFVVAGAFTLFAVQRNFKIRHAFLIFISVFLIFTVISPFYLSFRSAGQEARHTEVDDSMLSLIRRGLTEAKLQDSETLSEKGAQNLAHRFLLIRTVPFTLFQMQEERLPLFGKAFYQATTSALPRAFRPREGWVNPQNYVQMQYGLPLGDVSNSILASFIADFWIIGGVLGGFFMGLYLNFGTYVAFRVFERLPVAGLGIFGSLFILAINTENNPAFILTLPRNLFMMYLIFLGFKLVGFRIKDWSALPPPGADFLPPNDFNRRRF